MVNKQFDSEVLCCLDGTVLLTGAPNTGLARWMFSQHVFQINKIGDRSTSIATGLILYITMDGISVSSNGLLASESSKLTVFLVCRWGHARWDLISFRQLAQNTHCMVSVL